MPAAPQVLDAVHVGLALVEVDGECVVERDVVVRITDGLISAIEVGVGEPAQGQGVLSARDTFLLPGLINMHSHAGLQARSRMRSDVPNPQVFSSGFLAVAPGIGHEPPKEDYAREARWTLEEHVSGGTTTVVDVGLPFEAAVAMVEANRDFGVRLYVGVAAASRWYRYGADGILTTQDVGHLHDDFLAQSRALAELCADEPHTSAIIVPMQVENCSDDMLSDLNELALELDLPIHTHCAQNLVEVHESLRRYGRSSVRRLSELGLLRPGTVLGHCVYPDANPLAGVPAHDELGILAQAGVTVAHCPTVMSRLGLRGLGISGWQAAGINVVLGTDAHPRDLLAELRAALAYSRLVGLDPRHVTSGEVFDSATRSGGLALGDARLGRIRVGAPADLCTVALDAPCFGGVVFDPVRQIVELGSKEIVRDVIVGGVLRIEAGVPAIGEGWTRREAAERGGAALEYFESVPRWRPDVADAWSHFNATAGSRQASSFLASLDPDQPARGPADRNDPA